VLLYGRKKMLTKILVIITSADKTPTCVVPFIIDAKSKRSASGVFGIAVLGECTRS